MTRSLAAAYIGTVPACLAVLCAAVLSTHSGRAAETHYDLGGPCTDSLGPGPFAQISAAKNSGAWDRVVELEKQSVREGCRIEYRWRELATALLQAHRSAETLQVLYEMDSRAFDLNPSAIGTEHEELRTFMQSPQFKTSSLGMKIEQLKRTSDQRRARYREALRKLAPDQKPADHYIAKGACPFECCQYRRWTVLEDTDLVASPRGGPIVGKARKGTRVVGLTGEVHLKPEPVVVLGDGDLPKDSIAFMLDNLGEGYSHVYTQGTIIESFLRVADYCYHPAEACRAETLLRPNERTDPVWWVKVRLPNGITGWTDKPDHFGNKDACG